MARPLAARSDTEYRRALKRAFGDASPASFETIDPAVTNWPNAMGQTLRAAIRRRCAEMGKHVTRGPCSHCGPACDRVPRRWAPRRKVAIPGEEDARAYEAAAATLPRGRRALALLPLALGLRAEEVCNLTRASVKRAVKSGELIALRKGGAENVIPCTNAVALLQELLETPAAHGRKHKRIRDPQPDRAWERVGEILSPGCYSTQYGVLHALVRKCGSSAELSGMRPHLLRHAFATRMNRDGAPTRTIQAALGHAQITTTMRYVHPELSDVAKHQRDFNTPFATTKIENRDTVAKLDFSKIKRGSKFQNDWGQTLKVRALVENNRWGQTEIDRIAQLQIGDSIELPGYPPGSGVVRLRRSK